MPDLVREELARFIGLSPLSMIDFRTELSSCVTASDASESGGGVTFSRGLTEAGSFAAQCQIRGDVVEPLEVDSILTIGLFDGISALRVAVGALNWNILGHVSVESNAEARRVVEARFPTTTFVHDVQEVDEAMVRNWACQYSQASLVVIGSGAPCQGVSQLNSQRKGALRDQRSRLFQHIPRIRDLVKRAFPWARVASLSENVASMDAQDRAVMTQAFEATPWMVDAKDVSLARRPRLYWLDWEILPQEGASLQLSRDAGAEAFHEAHLEGFIKEENYLKPGWKRVGVEPLPTFTTSRCRSHEGHRPAGKEHCLPHELARWEADHYRYPPYQYRDKHCLRNAKGELRLPDIEERECIMGFPRGYTMQAQKKALQGTPDHEASRLTMIGNSWNVTIVAWLLNHLGYILGLHALMSPQQVIERTAPGAGPGLQSFLQRPPMRPTRASPGHHLEHRLVRKLTTLVSLKGEDLLLQAGSEDVVKYHRLRASLPARLWKWRVAASWQWTGVPGSANGSMPKRLLEGKTKEERIERRRQIGSLKDLTVQPATRARYDKALERFFDYLTHESLALPRNRQLMDSITSDYVEHLWSSGEGRALAADTIAGLQDTQPQLRGHLQGTWRLLKTWNNSEIPNRAPPMPVEVLDAMGGKRQGAAESVKVTVVDIIRRAEEEEATIDGMVEPGLQDVRIVERVGNVDVADRRTRRTRNEEEVRNGRAYEASPRSQNPNFWTGFFESSDEGDESYVPERGDRDEDDEDLDTGMRQFMEGSRWSEFRNEAWPSLMKVLQDPPVDDPHEPGLQLDGCRVTLLSGRGCVLQCSEALGIQEVLRKAEDALQVKLESLVSSQGTLAPHLRLRDVGSRDLVALAKTAQLVGHSRSLGFALLRADGQLLSWGAAEQRNVAASECSYAAVLMDGGLVTWGSSHFGGDSQAVQEQVRGLVQIQSSCCAFAALQEDGSVISWGHPSMPQTTAERLMLSAARQNPVTAIQSSSHAFAALLKDGSVTTWGNKDYGGDCSAASALLDVQCLQSSAGAFAALCSGGRVVAWGSADYGGLGPADLRDVTKIQASARAFAALRSDGHVVAWGDASCGGDTGPVARQLYDVVEIASAPRAFTALRADGMAIAWGDPSSGGDAELCEVTAIQVTSRAFAAIKRDGSVVTWGHSSCGGDSTSVSHQLWGVRHIQSSTRAFAALRRDGQVVAWGSRDFGGDAAAVQGMLYNVQMIQSSRNAFAALRGDGHVISWGGDDEPQMIDPTLRIRRLG
ncbi:unnamed protein product [Cladocopium goreaui]|uniref:DNA (Cytosine-5)-methyltransferase 3A (Dnmt3a) (Cysteine methyltransferase DNMT3A) n=1 Tax=Cladocopium goreaui TaxID=2562237 RepID=A0A9P1CGU1_9DINO|nr:unnamed protein product [Cladocopium goreaui]